MGVQSGYYTCRPSYLSCNFPQNRGEFLLGHVNFVHTYENIFAKILSIGILRALHVSRHDPWAHIKHPMCSVCVCTYTYTEVHSHPPRHQKQETQDNTFISAAAQNNPPGQATSAPHRLVEPLNHHPQSTMNKLCIHEHMCATCSDCVADMYVDVQNTCGIKTPACVGAQDTFSVHATLTAKMHIHPRK